MVDLSRRQLVAGALGVGVVGSGAYLGSQVLGGGPDPGEATGYQRWLASPDRLNWLRPSYSFSAVKMRPTRENRAVLRSSVIEQYTGSFWLPGIESLIDVERVDRVTGTIGVLHGGFDRGTVESALESAGYFRQDASGEFSRFEAGDDTHVGVSAENIVFAEWEAPFNVELDAWRGDVTRLAANRAGATLLAHLGHGDVINGVVDDLDQDRLGPATALGVRYDLGSESTDVRLVTVFDGGEKDPAFVSEWASEAEVVPDTDYSTSEDGRAVIATGTVPTGDIPTLEPNLMEYFG